MTPRTHDDSGPAAAPKTEIVGNKPCCGLTGRLFGHKYQARYNSEPVFPDKPSDAFAQQLQQFFTRPDVMVRRIYVAEVCERCGHVVLRKKETDHERAS